MTDYYQPDLAAGLRWDDRRFGINWPLQDVILNDRDSSYPDVDEVWLGKIRWERLDV
jgi:dTDP-4-dehydrorhamnose 3,5-epimerase